MNDIGFPPLDWLIRGADIFHATNLMRQPPRRAKLTATIHDLTCWLMPEVHTPGNVNADREFADNILCRADGLIAVSENTRQDAIRNARHRARIAFGPFIPASPRRISTRLPRLARPALCALSSAPLSREKISTRCSTPGRCLKPSLRDEFDLLIAGPRGWRSEQTFARIEREATYLGYVPEADLPGLTAGATLFVYPSLYEGFGFPVAQAMAAGAPVITSNNSCLPEIAGDAALVGRSEKRRGNRRRPHAPLGIGIAARRSRRARAKARGAVSLGKVRNRIVTILP